MFNQSRYIGLSGDGNAYFDYESLSHLYRSPTVFGRQIICIAEYWLAQKCRENTKEGDICIQNFWDEYRHAASPKYQAWCAVFPWFVIDEAAKTLGCSHKYPGYTDTWANAKDTWLQAAKVYKTDQNPVAGAFFYRKTLSAGYSGHMGIIVDYDSVNQQVYTIEGNIQVEDGKEGIGAWLYTLAELHALQFQVIHVELNPCNASEPVDYKGWKCKEATIAKTDSSGSGTGGSGTGGGGTAEKKQLPGHGTDTQNPPGSSQTTTDTYVPKTEEDCEDIIFKIPPEDSIQHFEALQNPAVVADIMEADYRSMGISNEERNGSALWYPSKNKDTGRSTGFGMFKDRSGNVIYVLNRKAKSTQWILDNNFVGPGMILFRLYGELGTGSNERQADRLRGWIGLDRIEITKSSVQAFMNELQLTSLDDFTRMDSNGSYQINILYALRVIEQSNKRLGYPIVILVDTPVPKSTDFVRRLEIALEIAAAVVPFVPGAGVVGQIVKRAKDTIHYIAIGSPFNFQNAIAIAESLAQVAQFLAPEFVKGIQTEANKIKGEIGKYLKTAENSLKNILNLKDDQSIPYQKNFRDAAGIIGIDTSVIENLYDNYIKGADNLIADLRRLTGTTFSDADKAIHNIKNILMLDQIRRKLNSGSVITTLIEKGSVTQIPIIQDLLIAGGTDSVLPALPNIDKFVNAMLINVDPFNDIHKRTGDKAANLQAALVGSVFGYIPNKNVFDDWTIDALINKARKQIGSDIPFFLPPSIPEDKQECYKIRIEQDGEVPVFWCPPGWDYDTAKRKCIRQDGFTSVPNAPSSPGIDTSIDIYNGGGSTPGGGGGTIPGGGGGTIPGGGGGTIPGSGWDLNLITEDKTKYDTSITVVPPGGPQITLPPCIIVKDGKYWMNTDYLSSQSSAVIDNNNPVQYNDNVVPIDAKNAGASQVITTDKGAGANTQQEPTLPADSSLFESPVGRYIPVQPVPYDVIEVNPAAASTLPVLPVNLPAGQANLSIPAAGSPSGGLSDNLVPAMVKDLGKSTEEWFAFINGEWYSIVNCNPVKIPQKDVPDIPVVIALPACIVIIDDKYYMKYQGGMIPAGKDENDNWYGQLNGQWYQMKNCDLEIPQQPATPGGKIPSLTHPDEPSSAIPYVPTTPVTPYVPGTPAQPTTPVTPKTPEKPAEPNVPEIPSRYIPETPKTTTPGMPVTPGEPVVPVTPQTPSQNIPETPKTKAPGTPEDCGCDLVYPKMVTRNEKIVYRYPKCDEHCCDDNCD